jgi:hypothetical protein
MILLARQLGKSFGKIVALLRMSASILQKASSRHNSPYLGILQDLE